MKKAILAAAAVAAMFSASTAFAQGGGGGGGGGGGSGDAGADGISPNGPSAGPVGSYATQVNNGRSVSNGGANAIDVMRTQPPGSENQQR